MCCYCGYLYRSRSYKSSFVLVNVSSFSTRVVLWRSCKEVRWSQGTPPRKPKMHPRLFLLLVLAVSTSATTVPREPCIVIADVGGDDGLALLLALASTELEILGVASSFGSHSDVRQTSANAKTLMAAAYHVPVYVGSRVPYGGSTRDPVPDGSFIHGTDGFGGLGGSVSDCDASSAVQPSASEWMVSTIRAAPGQVTILCFSPLTNLALAVALEPLLPRLVRRVILMGGALAHAGNASPLAEANFAHDAAAAKAVLDAWAAHAATDVHQLVLLPLDYIMISMQNLVTLWGSEVYCTPGCNVPGTTRLYDSSSPHALYSQPLSSSAPRSPPPGLLCLVVGPILGLR